MSVINTINKPLTRISFQKKAQSKQDKLNKHFDPPFIPFFKGISPRKDDNNVRFLSNNHGDTFVKRTNTKPEASKDEGFSFLDWYVEGIAPDYTYF